MPKPNAPASGGRRRGRSTSSALATLAGVLMAVSAAAVMVLNFAPNLSSYALSSFSSFSSSLKSLPVQFSNPINDQKKTKVAEEEDRLGQRRDSSSSPGNNVERDGNLSKLEARLARARNFIKLSSKDHNAASLGNDSFVPLGPIYKNASAFYRSYLEMEKAFRVFVYEEGDPPLFHDGPCRSIYSSEGRFIYGMESGSRFRTANPERAHVFLLPFSVSKMVKFIDRSNRYDIAPMQKTVADYINIISHKYRFWNRSLGADHFFISCHDWAPRTSSVVAQLYENSIRVLCNANTSEGFNPLKDVSLPEINLKTDWTATELKGGPPPSQRPILAFFAGGLHGPIRPLLLQHWKNKDEDLRVYEYLPKGVSYYDMMRTAKFCLCPSGHEVASPRTVEAIILECVPVIITEGYVLPFSDVLNWKAFSVQVETKDIPNLKKILLSIPPTEYIKMQQRLKLVQRHFEVNSPPKRFDVFHMILHSVWLRRLNTRVNPKPAAM